MTLNAFRSLRDRWAALGYRQVRRVVIFVVGMTVVVIGLALLVFPGPATLVIPAGLAILGIEFEWARRCLRKARAMLKQGVNAVTGYGKPTAAAPGNPAPPPPRSGA